MTVIDTHYTFLSYFRKGVSASLTNTEEEFSNDRSHLNLKLRINDGNSIRNPLSTNGLKIDLIGPHNISGINPNIISKTDPICRSEKNTKIVVNNFEPNYFTSIEFTEPDFPWRYTPFGPDDTGKLKPWICLIVLKDDEMEMTETNSTITIKKHDGIFPLPDLNEIHAWAHVHIIDPDADLNNTTDLQDLIERHPEKTISRIICPRHLEPNTSYHAFLVPTFKLNLENNLIPNWDQTHDDPIVISYYFEWEFSTGSHGDFEHLVRLLKSRIIDSRVGIRQMNCTDPQKYGITACLDDIPDGKLGLEGALKTITTESTRWPSGLDSKFQNDLSKILNKSNISQNDGTSIPTVVPPIYGKWAANITNVGLNENIPWIRTLNLDPRNRTAAGFGANVIKEQQEDLMYSAWKQVGELELANSIITKGHLVCKSLEKVFQNDFVSSSPTFLFSLSAPVHSRLTMPTDGNDKTIETIRNKIENSKIPRSIFDPAFMRIYRKGGPIRKKQKFFNREDDLLTRINNDVLDIPKKTKPDGSISLNDITDKLMPIKHNKISCKLTNIFYKLFTVISLAILFILVYGTFSNTMIVYYPYLFMIFFCIITMALFLHRLSVHCSTVNTLNNPIPDNMSDNLMIDKKYELTLDGKIVPDNKEHDVGQTMIDLGKFLNIYLYPQKTVNLELPSLNIHKIKTIIVESLDPQKTISDRIHRRIHVEDVTSKDTRKFDLIRSNPNFPQPMYEPLRDISQELLLPGLKHIPQNTVGILLTNQKFVESYMCGLNHEMSKELLWREYPTDMRGSYFRQFWDVRSTIMPEHIWETLRDEITSDTIPAPSEQKLSHLIDKRWKEYLYDIKQIHTWVSDLGLNAPTRHIVEFKQESRIMPIFTGTLEPDITFIGFELTIGDIKNNETDGGYFFIMEERVSESRFGLDVENSEIDDLNDTWDNFSWTHIKNNGFISASQYILLCNSNTRNSPFMALRYNFKSFKNFDSACMASVTHQKPFRIAIPAKDMIPDEISRGQENEKLVLLLRGDLLKKYPGTVIYVVKGIMLNGKSWPITFQRD